MLRYLTVRVEGDSRFSREGANVHSEETISLADAALGGTKVRREYQQLGSSSCCNDALGREALESDGSRSCV